MLDFFILPFSTSFHFGNLIQLTIFLLLPSLAAIFPLKTGALNLGGDGQIYAGGLFSTLVLLCFSETQSTTTMIFVLFLATLVAMTTGALLAFVSGWALEKANISEVVSSFLISAAFIPIGDYLLGSVFLDNGAVVWIPGQERLQKSVKLRRNVPVFRRGGRNRSGQMFL